MKASPYDLSSLPVTLRQEVPPEYRDLMGHMNVMWYTHLFSRAFGGFGNLFGFNAAYFRAHHAGSFVLETHIRYLREVHVGNHITVCSRALGRTPKRMHYIHFMTIDETGELAATFELVGAHIDMHTRRMAPLPDEIGERFDKLLAEHQALPWEPPVCGVMRP